MTKEIAALRNRLEQWAQQQETEAIRRQHHEPSRLLFSRRANDLHAAVAFIDRTLMRELDAELLAGSRAEARGDDRV